MPNEWRKVLIMTSTYFIYPDIQLLYLCANTVHIKSQQVSENHHQQWLLLVHPRWGCSKKSKLNSGVPAKELQDHIPNVKLATNTTTVEPHIRVCLSCLGSPQVQGHLATVKQNWTPSSQVCDQQLHRQIIRHCWCHSHAWKSAVDKVLNNEDEKSCLRMLAMSTFSPVGSGSSNGTRICVCVCGRNELQVCNTLAYPHIYIYIYISSFCTMTVLYTSTHTHTSSNHLRTVSRWGLKVDIAGMLYKIDNGLVEVNPASLLHLSDPRTRGAQRLHQEQTKQPTHPLPLLLPLYSLWMEPPPRG